MYDIRFPHLGIVFRNIKDGFKVFGFEIKFYGLVIVIGFLLAFLMVSKEAKRTGQKEEDYLDLFLWIFIPSILGARLYYVIFSWKEYFVRGQGIGKTLLGLINIRNGGLAIYGGVITGFIVAYVFAKKRKMSFPLIGDTAVCGILIGQILGRWGNFFNREAFGGYTDSLFSMCIPADYYQGNGSLSSLVAKGVITQEMAEHAKVIDGMNWISVHPTFLYESVWNLVLLILLLMYRKHKKFDGEVCLMYFWGYGLGRVWIEGLRSDSLMIGPLKVSQLLAALCVLVASALIVIGRLKKQKQTA